MSWGSDTLNKFHGFTKWADPLTHYGVVDLAHDTSTKSVRESGRSLKNIFGDETPVGKFGEHWQNMAQYDQNDFGRWGANSLMGAGAVVGGMYGAGALGAGGVSSSAGAGGVDAAPGALGYGMEGQAGYVMPGSGGSLNGAGLDAYGFNPNGFTAASGNYDIPGGVTGQIPSGMGGQTQGLAAMLGGNAGGSGGRGGTGRQNLPLMENEKTDAQKLAELLKALQQQDQGYA